jgi:Tfp pilus assembly protein PilF
MERRPAPRPSDGRRRGGPAVDAAAGRHLGSRPGRYAGVMAVQAGSRGRNDRDGGGDDTMEANRSLDLALNLLRKAYEQQMAGNLDEAVRLYRASIDSHPTAEAHTFLGWTLSFQGRYEEAIAQCRIAIAIDPDFGNPYNDIGSYLIHLGRTEEAIPWLERAKRAPRYEPRHFPYLNLYRAYMKIGRLDAAQRELQQALFIQKGLEMQAGIAADEEPGPALH